jgi:hypothetical protein
MRPGRHDTFVAASASEWTPGMLAEARLMLRSA